MPRTGWTPEELKQKALDAAELVIRKSGFERSKLTDVARDLGISHATLYKHFANKDDLLDAVTGRWLERIDAELAEIACSEAPLAERIQAWFLTLHLLKRQKVMADPALYEAFNASATRHWPSVAGHLNHMQQQLETMIREGIAKGELPEMEVGKVVQILFEGTAAYHHPRLVLDHIETDQTGALQAVLETLLKGLGCGLSA